MTREEVKRKLDYYAWELSTKRRGFKVEDILGLFDIPIEEFIELSKREDVIDLFERWKVAVDFYNIEHTQLEQETAMYLSGLRTYPGIETKNIEMSNQEN